MKQFYAVTLSIGISLLQLSQASADEVISQAEDTTAGAAFGAGTGVLIGGAAGGPLGALIGAVLGVFGGREVQKTTGLEERAYAVRSDTGEERVVRSPRQEFAIGQQVEVRGNRLHIPSPR